MANDNDIKKSRTQELDEFWDLSSLVPKKSESVSFNRRINVEAVEVTNTVKTETKENENSTVIKRYINPLHYENKRIRKESYVSEESYCPENSLLHKVTIRKKKCEYELYAQFYQDALKYKDKQGVECDYVPYYSYVPQYDQLSETQLNYYFWWRDNFKSGVFIKTDQSYVLLYIFELLNIGGLKDPQKTQTLLCDIWSVYHTEFSSLSSKLALWICDFSLLYRLPVPTNAPKDIGKHVLSLKEFYLDMPKGDFEACARSLIKYGTEYDYRASKFAKGDNLKLFDKYVLGAVEVAVRFYSKDGAMLSELASEDSKVIRNVFEGALCTNSLRYELEVKYCSFSRSNELRYIMADIVKYAENKIRTYIGVKSKLTVYSVSIELQKAIDSYFENSLFSIPKVAPKKEEKHDYDALYDLPRNEFSLSNAKNIENASWNVTEELISAFEMEEIKVTVSEHSDIVPDESIVESDTANAEEDRLLIKLGEYGAFAKALKSGDMATCRNIARSLGKLEDAIVDAINELAVDEIGDILIEEGDDGYEILECYSDMI